MWDWLLNHWWVANVIPYFWFNAWALYVFQRDEGTFSNNARFWFVLLGLFIILFTFGWIFLEELGDWLNQMNVFARRLKRERYWAAFRRAAILTLKLGAVAVAFIVIYLLILVTLPGARPGWMVVLAEVLGFTPCAVVVGMYYHMKKREK